MAKQYEWVNFYKAFAKKLLKFKSDRNRLLSIIKETYSEIDISLPTLERSEEALTDIDPFTTFGLFNKSHMTNDNRVKIITALSKKIGVELEVPKSFNGVPTLNNQNATYYCFQGDEGRNDSDIDNLWKLFETGLNYADDPSEENLKAMLKFFDAVINKKGNGNSKITMALYWIAPETFLNLDSRNIWYIYKSGKMPKELISKLPKVTSATKIAAVDYFKIVETLRSYLKSGVSALENFIDLSYEAWRYSEEINQQNARAFEGIETDDIEGEASEQNYPKYNAEQFLEEVYMESDEYDILVDLVKAKMNVILQGAPGVGKTFAAERLAYSIMGVKAPSRVMVVQFHQSYSYEDFIMGYRPTEKGFELKKGVFYNFCKKAETDSNNDYFFIIDEINRGNLSKIFGELFMLIETDKRGIELQLLYSDEKFSIPKNVYIIGMMNTADRSLAMLDYALRRRFAFYEMRPCFESEGFRIYQQGLNNSKFDNLISCVKSLNNAIAADESLGEGFCIGHSYFCNMDNATDTTLKRIVEYELIPLLKEYWFDEPTRGKDWAYKLRNSIQ